ncbi:MAG: TIGR02206 family membrane protein [Marmoricola sp.]
MPIAATRFESFSGQHVALLVLFVAGAVVLVLLGQRHRSTSSSRLTRRLLAIGVVCAAVPNQLYVLSPGVFRPGSAVPLELCDLAWMTAVWALWTRSPLPTALTYYWGLTLTVQGVVTPSLGHVFPEPQYFVFWAKHLLVVWSALYLTLGLGLGPTWREYRLAVGLTAVWAVVVYAFDKAFDANYGYLVHKPESASLLDAFGPWPAYIVVSMGILVAGWALITWPWVVAGRRQPLVSH